VRVRVRGRVRVRVRGRGRVRVRARVRVSALLHPILLHEILLPIDHRDEPLPLQHLLHLGRPP
jgi:IS5 family transposase